MGRIIVCDTKQATKPYIFSNTKVAVYSYEELCYYIFHNMPLLHPDYFKAELIRWIGQELEMQDLANELIGEMAAEAPLLEMLVTILSAREYYNQDEIRIFIANYEDRKNQTGLEQLKETADSFLLYKRYVRAISIYNKILEKEKLISDKKFLGNVYHNKGVALAKNLELEEARTAFLRAFSLNEDDDSIRQYFVVLMMMKSYDQVKQEAQTIGMPAQKLEDMVEEITQARDDAQGTSVYKKFHKAMYNYDHGDLNDFNKRVDMIITQWKQEFREQTI